MWCKRAIVCPIRLMFRNRDYDCECAERLRRDGRRFGVVTRRCQSGVRQRLRRRVDERALSDAAYAAIINGPHLQNLVLGMSTKEKARKRERV